MEVVVDSLGDHAHDLSESASWERLDDGASPVLATVVNEFAKKGEKAAQSPDARVAVIELEQAGDSAKVAAEADPECPPLHGTPS
jgi:hypothetical protein